MQNNFYNIEIEKSVLNSCIYDPQHYENFGHLIKKELFFTPFHQEILFAIQELYIQEKPIEESFIKSILQSRGVYNEVAFIELLTTTPLSNLAPYIETLQSFNLKRTLHKLSTNIQFKIESQEEPEKLLSQLHQQIEKISESDSAELLELYAADTIVQKDIEFILKSWLPFPQRTVSLVTAPGGTGKSWFILQISTRFLIENENEKAFLWLSEDPKELSKHRLTRIWEKVLSRSDNINHILKRLFISDSQTFGVLEEQGRGIGINPTFHKLKSILKPYKLIVLDPLIAFFGGDENSNSHARRFMQLFTNWASKENKTIIFIHHSTKNTTQSRGASAFVDAVRLVYEIDFFRENEKEVNLHNRKITVSKDNYGVKSILKHKNVERQLFPKEPVPIIKEPSSKESINQFLFNDGTPEDF